MVKDVPLRIVFDIGINTYLSKGQALEWGQFLVFAHQRDRGTKIIFQCQIERNLENMISWVKGSRERLPKNIQAPQNKLAKKMR